MLDTFNDDFDIVSITETLLSDNNIFIFNIPGYNNMISSRKHKSGSGVNLYLIYIRENYKFNILSTISNNYYDNISIEIIIEKSKNIIFITIYFPSTLAYSTFIDFLKNNFQQHVINDKKMIICEDFNIDLVHIHTSKVANTFFDTINSLGFTHLINHPTRIDT